MLRYLALLILLAVPPAAAQDHVFPTPGNANVPGFVTMCLNGSNQAVPCNPSSITAGTTPTTCSTTQVLFALAGVVSCDSGLTYAGSGGNLSAPRFIQLGGFANTFLCALSNFNIFASDSGTTCEAGAGFSAASLASTSFSRAKAFQSVSPVPSVSGTCGSFGTPVGGNTAGTLSSTAICAAASTIILTTFQAATNGYSCFINDQTTSTAKIRQTASSTSGATFTVDVATAANDVLNYGCIGY